MKNFMLGAMLLASFAVSLPTLAQAHPNAQPTPNLQPPPCEDPDDPGCPGGGGGGGGPQYTVPPNGTPALNWTGQGNQNYNVLVGGPDQREKVGAAINQNDGKLYVAVTSRTNDDGNGNHAIGIYTNTDGSSNLTFLGNLTVQYSNGPSIVYTKLAPALIYSSLQGGQLFIAYNSGYAITLARSAGGGSTFTYVTQFATSYSGPSLADDPAHQRLYVSFLDGDRNLQSTNNLVLISVDQNGNYLTYASLGANMGFDPGMAIGPNGTLYIAGQDFNSHQINLFQTTNGTQLYQSSTAANDSTSTTPSVALSNGLLYIGFRTNDGDHKFLYKYSADGNTWTTVDPHYQMGGPPTLVSNIREKSGVPQYVPNSLMQLFNAFGADQDNRPFTLAHTY
ncbi:hypothetical protein [Terriglobus sp.]|uniref:hypothetical protein n=1 Tax=Terriglobus sp. TaxID=1889013 RepID=UPI003B00FE72